MKKSLIYMSAVFALTSCLKTEFEPRERTSGSADFSNYVAVGNSLTQGYQDGGLHNELSQQENSFPALIAAQMAKVDASAGGFEQPLVTGDGSGYKKLSALDPIAGPTIVDVAPDASWSSWGNKSLKYNNLGISGIRLIDCVGRNTGEKIINHIIFDGTSVIPGFNDPVNPYGRFLDWGGDPLALGTPIEYIDHIRNSKATFFTCWLGNNDVLGWATAGGVTDVTTITIPLVGSVEIVKSRLTPQDEFREKYDSVLTVFKNMGAKGVVATLPDVTSIPFFTTITLETYGIKHTMDSLKQATGGLLGTDFYIVDSTGTTRPLNPGKDFITLTATDTISSGAGFSPLLPLPNEFVLDEGEVNRVRAHTQALNNIIKNLASNYGFGVVDMYSFLGTLKSGYTFNGVDFSASYIEGGAFSLDGVHPNTKGYAIVANEFIRVINEKYGSTIPPVDVNAYNGIIFP